MQKLRTEKGITLIALVITIIVMLILVGVSVTVALNGGLFSTAKEAAEGTATKRNEELELSSGKVEINGEWYNSIDEYVNESETTEYTAYSVGDTVTIGTENFYVIADSDATQEKVTLLAEYGIDTTTLLQTTIRGTLETTSTFSSTNYWSSETEYPLDLNNYTIPEGVTTPALTAAKTYGSNLGGTGRLMTYEEAEALKTAHSDIFGVPSGEFDGSVNYWLGSASDASAVYTALSQNCSVTTQSMISVARYAVRPVVEISKSNIS